MRGNIKVLKNIYCQRRREVFDSCDLQTFLSELSEKGTQMEETALVSADLSGAITGFNKQSKG